MKMMNLDFKPITLYTQDRQYLLEYVVLVLTELLGVLNIIDQLIVKSNIYWVSSKHTIL